MNYGLADALSQIKPSELSADRFAKQQTQMLQLKDMYTRDQNANAEAESKYQEQIGLVQENINLLSETGRAEMQTVIEENKKLMQKEIAKNGNMSQFMRNGGARLIGEYKNRILSDDRFNNHKRATESLAQIQQLLAAGEGNKLSNSTLQNIEKYKNGLIETFEPVIINPLVVPEKKYYEDIAIETQSMLDENYAAIKANFMLEYPDVEVTPDRLYKYTKQYYGAALGAKINTAKASRERAQSKGAKSGMEKELYMFSHNNTHMYSSIRDQGNVSATGNESLKSAIFDQGYNLNTPYEFQRQKKFETETGNLPAEMYQMNESFGGKLWSNVASSLNKPQNEDGTYTFDLNEIYDEDGIYGGGERTEGTEQFSGKFMGVFMVKGNEDVINQGTGEKESMIFMKNKDGDFQENIDADYEDISGYGIEVAMFKDPDSGETFYKQIETSDAASTGVHNQSWGEMDEMGDDLQRTRMEQRKEAQIKSWDDERVSEVKNVFNSNFRQGLNDELKIAGLPMSTNVMGGYIAALTHSQMDQHYSNAEGAAYDSTYKALFEIIQGRVFDSLNGGEEGGAKLKSSLAMASSDADARKILVDYIKQEFPQGNTEEYYKKYVNIFNINKT